MCLRVLLAMTSSRFYCSPTQSDNNIWLTASSHVCFPPGRLNSNDDPTVENGGARHLCIYCNNSIMTYIYIYRAQLPKQNPVRTDDLAKTIMIKYMDTGYNVSSILYISLKSAVRRPNIPWHHIRRNFNQWKGR